MSNENKIILSPEAGTVRIMSSNVLHADDPSSLSSRLNYHERAKLLADCYLNHLPDL